ncbi:MAG: hypothetical protein WC903_06645 [Candidatus Margulisiibacteriota bacterium]
MTGKEKIVAMIPARMGSTRLAKKNLALINGQPMIYYPIAAAKKSGVFDKIILNSENEVFAGIAERYGVEFYHRPEKLGSSEAKSDDVVFDFMEHHPADITVWVNSTSPLQSGEEVRAVVRYFQEKKLDGLITVREEQVHCLYDGQPLNFQEDGLFARTQDLIPVQRFVYSVMMWRNKTFQKTYKEKGYALFCGKMGYYPVSKESALIIKTEDDLKMVEALLVGKEKLGNYDLRYDEVAGDA